VGQLCLKLIDLFLENADALITPLNSLVAILFNDTLSVLKLFAEIVYRSLNFCGKTFKAGFCLGLRSKDGLELFENTLRYVSARDGWWKESDQLTSSQSVRASPAALF